MSFLKKEKNNNNNSNNNNNNNNNIHNFKLNVQFSSI